MHIGIKEAAAIYARVCRARYGSLARRIVAEQARSLRTRGDLSGAEVWHQVAVEIESAEQKRKDAQIARRRSAS